MHPFNELIHRSTAFSLSALEAASQRVSESLEASGATPLVKALQMIQLQKAISAVGMFSIFDAVLQRELHCKDGFPEAMKVLAALGESALKDRFYDLQLAINVLKHGKGRSYDELVQKAASLPFRIKLPGEAFFEEGDVGEISSLIKVDNPFVLLCAEVIEAVSFAIKGKSAHGA